MSLCACVCLITSLRHCQQINAEKAEAVCELQTINLEGPATWPVDVASVPEIGDVAHEGARD